MEKRYIKPQIEVTVINAEAVMAATSTISTGSGNIDGENLGSRNQSLSDDFWDE